MSCSACCQGYRALAIRVAAAMAYAGFIGQLCIVLGALVILEVHAHPNRQSYDAPVRGDAACMKLTGGRCDFLPCGGEHGQTECIGGRCLCAGDQCANVFGRCSAGVAQDLGMYAIRALKPALSQIRYFGSVGPSDVGSFAAVAATDDSFPQWRVVLDKVGRGFVRLESTRFPGKVLAMRPRARKQYTVPTGRSESDASAATEPESSASIPYTGLSTNSGRNSSASSVPRSQGHTDDMASTHLEHSVMNKSRQEFVPVRPFPASRQSGTGAKAHDSRRRRRSHVGSIQFTTSELMAQRMLLQTRVVDSRASRHLTEEATDDHTPAPALAPSASLPTPSALGNERTDEHENFGVDHGVGGNVVFEFESDGVLPTLALVSTAATAVARGGNALGNSRLWPELVDILSLEPIEATFQLRRITGGFELWDPWRGVALSSAAPPSWFFRGVRDATEHGITECMPRGLLSSGCQGREVLAFEPALPPWVVSHEERLHISKPWTTHWWQSSLHAVCVLMGLCFAGCLAKVASPAYEKS